MALDNIPGKNIFKQRDVRETPSATATATVSEGGVKNAQYLLLTSNELLESSRTLKAGDGITFTDGGAGGNLTIKGKDATSAIKGIASFNSDDFNVVGGAVSLKGGESYTFDEDDFEIDEGEVSLKQKTKTLYWSVPGMAFIPQEGVSDYLYISTQDPDGALVEIGQGMSINPLYGTVFRCPVNLPHGAKVLSIVVYGNSSSEKYYFDRTYLTDKSVSESLANNYINTQKTSINHIVNNKDYHYYLRTKTIGAGDTINGARITYEITE